MVRCSRRATSFAYTLPLKESIGLWGERTMAPVSDYYACEQHRTELHHNLDVNAPPPVCERCGSTVGVKFQNSRTAYDTSYEPWWKRLLTVDIDSDVLEYINPNRDPVLCADCATEHHAYWDDMWSNVEGY